MPKKASTVELSISPRIAGRYAAAAKRLNAKSTAGAPTAAKLISLELMGRTPAGIVEDFEQGAGGGAAPIVAASSLRGARKMQPAHMRAATIPSIEKAEARLVWPERRVAA